MTEVGGIIEFQMLVAKDCRIIFQSLRMDNDRWVPNHNASLTLVLIPRQFVSMRGHRGHEGAYKWIDKAYCCC